MSPITSKPLDSNETLIRNIWKKYRATTPTRVQIAALVKKAKASYQKSDKKYKLGTFISWWTRQYLSKK